MFKTSLYTFHRKYFVTRNAKFFRSHGRHFILEEHFHIVAQIDRLFRLPSLTHPPALSPKTGSLPFESRPFLVSLVFLWSTHLFLHRPFRAPGHPNACHCRLFFCVLARSCSLLAFPHSPRCRIHLPAYGRSAHRTRL